MKQEYLCIDCDKNPSAPHEEICSECMDIRACNYETTYSESYSETSHAAAVEQAYGPNGLKRR